MKKWIPIIIISIAVIITIYFLNQAGLMKTKSAEELEKSMEVIEWHTKWVKKYYQPWPPKLILVPAISFKIKNISDKPLKYVNFNAIFRFRNDYENMGDCFLAAIRAKPVLPGEISDEILLVSNYGVEGKTKASFPNNPYWKVVVCKLYAASSGSPFIHLGDYTVTKMIDFEEPEEVGIKPADKKEEKRIRI